LVSQVLVARQKAKIKRLTKTFLTLSLEDVASRAGLENSKEAEKYLVSMVESGEIFAKISHKDGMVKFGTKPEKYNSVEMLRKLEKHVGGIIEVTDRIDQLDEEILMDKEYRRKIATGEAGRSTRGLRPEPGLPEHPLDLIGEDDEDFGISDTYMPMSSTKRKLPFGGRFKSSSTPTASTVKSGNEGVDSNVPPPSNPAAASNSATKMDTEFLWSSSTTTACTAASNSAAASIPAAAPIHPATVSNSTTEMASEGLVAGIQNYAEAFNSLQGAVSNSADQPIPQPMVTSTDGNSANCSEADSVSIQETDENNETL